MSESPNPGLLGEFFAFLRHHKAWWLLPMLVVFILFVILAILSGTGTAPFIYTAP